MTKRIYEISFSLVGLLVLSPILIVSMILVWLQDYQFPLYISTRIGYKGRSFKMIKLRTMISHADRSGVDSTSAHDPRITPMGHFIRRYKIDELFQLWNVFIGDMSFVGPRPNVKRETDLYTREERHLFDVRPGMTDFASIAFSDEGEILKHHADPDIAYNQVIRPWKSRLGLLYVAKNSIKLDFKIVVLTFLVLWHRPLALALMRKVLNRLGCEDQVLAMATRAQALKAYPPPGSDKIVTSRESTQIMAVTSEL